ncbi:MAG: TetR/AcrR family transcriptional regulator [Acidimicrobiales bacterium]
MSANRRLQPDQDNAPDVDRNGREGRREAQRAARRDGLLAAAIHEIRTTGPGATMEQLAKAGGVTKPILYRHFGDRDGLIDAIAQRFSTDLITSVTTPLLTESYPKELLDSTIGAYVGFLERDPYLYGFLIQQASTRSGERTPISSLVSVVSDQLALVVEDQLRAAGRDTGAAVPWAYAIVGLVHQATNWWLRDGTMSRERFLGYVSDLLWDGLSGPHEDAEAGTET